jgi:hypothetical protein
MIASIIEGGVMFTVGVALVGLVAIYVGRATRSKTSPAWRDRLGLVIELLGIMLLAGAITLLLVETFPSPGGA